MLILFTPLLFWIGSCRRVQEHPLSKVIGLLASLQDKVKHDAEACDKTYEAYVARCRSETQTLNSAINEAKREMMDATAQANNEKAKIERLTVEISKSQEAIAGYQSHLVWAGKIRDEETSRFDERYQLADELQRAIYNLKHQLRNGMSALQGAAVQPVMQALDALVKGSLLNAAEASRLAAMIQRDDAEENEDDSEIDAAISQTDREDIIEALKSLLTSIQRSLEEARENERILGHQYRMLKQSLENQIQREEDSQALAKSSIAWSTKKKEQAEGDLTMASRALEDAQEQLTTLTDNCAKERENYEDESASREEELKAIDDALKALGDLRTRTHGLFGAAFLQLSQDSRTFDGASKSLRSSASSFTTGARIITFVRDLALREGEPELSQLASRVAAVMQQGAAAGEEPFAKVMNMIRELIARLEAEAPCNSELQEAQAKLDVKKMKFEKLQADVGDWSAEAAQLKLRTTDAQKALDSLLDQQAAMDTVRKKQRDEYERLEAHLKSGLRGTRLALKQYYSITKEKKHEAREGTASAIIAYLENIESIFSRDMAAAEEIEYERKTDYEAETQSRQALVATMKRAVQYKTRGSEALDRSDDVAADDGESLKEEIDALSKIVKTLTVQCSDKALSYEERKRRREDEIAGLKQALEILGSRTALVQLDSRHSRHALKLKRTGG